ncbi:amidohydrolase family protein [Phenylobacterium sp.]|uniref:metal-dependent hydrolase family protein n=1 Tax=Phenylobacterium sp. TaxID=1871053 RepID=UPI0035AFCA26
MTDFIICNAKLLDVAAGELRGGASIRVEAGKVMEVAEDGRALSAGEGVTVIDAGGRTLMPGLIDAHVHAAITTMDLAAMGRRQTSWIAIETKFVLEGMLRRGFTTVRDAGGMDPGITNALDRGLVKGPRVFRSGRVISQTGGHGDSSGVSQHPQLCACDIKSSAFSHVADGVDAVRKAVREELKAGAHQIKVMAGGGVATPSDPIDMVQYTEAEIRAAVEEAQARRTYAFAHAYIPEAIERAVRAGVRSIEHGNLIDEASAKFMAQQGCYLVPTLVTYDQIAEFGKKLRFPEESLKKLDAVFGAGLGALEIAKRAGVKMGFGTDLLGETHPAQSKEFVLRAQVLPAAEIIASATLVNAELLGQAGKLGVLAPGAHADLLLVDGDPLADIGVLNGQGERIDLIARGGEIVVNRL